MKIKILSILLICFGLLNKPVIINAQDKLLEIDLKKDKRDLLMYFDLKEKGMLYVTTNPGQWYYLIHVNPDNKIVWESSINKKEWIARGKVKVHYTDEHIYFIQLAGINKHGLSILQFDEKGKQRKFENDTEEYDGINSLFTDDNKLYAVQHRVIPNEKPVNCFIPFNPEKFTPEKPIKLNLPELKRGSWDFLGFDEKAYFYGIQIGINPDGSQSAYIIPATVSGRVSDIFIMNIKPKSSTSNITVYGEDTQLELDPVNNNIYAFGLVNNEKENKGIKLKYHGFYINKYDLDGNFISGNFYKFKDLQQTYPEVKDYKNGFPTISLVREPILNSYEIITWNINVNSSSNTSHKDIYSFKLDSTFKLKKVIYVPSANPSLDILRIGLSTSDYIISVILGYTPYKEYKDDAVVKKLADLTAETKKFKSTVYNLKYYEDRGIIMEYIASEKLLKLHSVKL